MSTLVCVYIDARSNISLINASFEYLKITDFKSYGKKNTSAAAQQLFVPMLQLCSRTAAAFYGTAKDILM